jgi:hypothetical protein
MDQPESMKEYKKPEIIHEIELETRAGSPLGDPLIDPLGTPSDGSTSTAENYQQRASNLHRSPLFCYTEQSIFEY